MSEQQQRWEVGGAAEWELKITELVKFKPGGSEP